jgi:cell division protein FtsZ
MDMTLFEVDEAANRIRAEVDPDANIIVGSTFNQDLEGRVRVSVVATGIDIEERDISRPQIKINTGAISKPWREPVSVDRPAPMPAASPVATAPAVSAAPRPAATTTAAAPAVNPVGDVHERIRKMLTEGQMTEPLPRSTHPVRAPAAQRPIMRPSAEPRPEQRQDPRHEQRHGINPFRGAQALGKHSLEAAVDMFKALGGAEDRRDIAPPRAPEAPRPATGSRAESPRGDLFDDQDDADLEIPSFLRKKKTG